MRTYRDEANRRHPLSSPPVVALNQRRIRAARVAASPVELSEGRFLLDERLVTLAGEALQRVTVQNSDDAARICNHAFVLHLSRDLRYGGPADAKHLRQQFLGQGDRIAFGAIGGL